MEQNRGNYAMQFMRLEILTNEQINSNREPELQVYEESEQTGYTKCLTEGSLNDEA